MKRKGAMGKNPANKIAVFLIALFYLISGAWEYLLSFSEDKGVGLFLFDLYRIYIYYLGIATLIIGVGLLFRLKIAKRLALFFAWWNLFSSPALDIWRNIYLFEIKKTTSISNWWHQSILIIMVLIMIRILIIRFLKEESYKLIES